MSSQSYHSEEYLAPEEIKFRYILSATERKILIQIIDDVLRKYKSPKESIPYVKDCMTQISELCRAMNEFFEKNPGNYFIRLSSCSPKDAYYQLCVETPAEDEVEDIVVTPDLIKLELSLLKVSTVEQCILVLCHSERVFYDLDSSLEMAVLLMDWKNDILYDTETRCFIKGSKLVAFSQYYVDLENGYKSVLDNSQISVSDIYHRVLHFINHLLTTNKVPYSDAVVDIAMSNIENNGFIFIEINPFNIGTDSGLFDWDYINEYNGEPCFRYKCNDKLIEFKTDDSNSKN